MVGVFCERGIVHPRNVSLAILWYTIAARSGDRQALQELRELWAQTISGHAAAARRRLERFSQLEVMRFRRHAKKRATGSKAEGQTEIWKAVPAGNS
eukprot:g80766.t1